MLKYFSCSHSGKCKLNRDAIFIHTIITDQKIRKIVNVRQPLLGTAEWNCKFAKHFQEAITQY